MSNNNLSPEITAFLCHWGPFTGAERMGREKKLPGSFRLVRVFCSGSVDPVLVVNSLLKGSDGIMVLGCHPGGCHYVNGNSYAGSRMEWVRRFLKLIEINPERVSYEGIAAPEDERLLTFINRFSDRVKELGILGKGEGLDSDEMKLRLAALREVLNGERLRWLIGKEPELADKNNVFGEKITGEEYNRIVSGSFLIEYKREKILLALKEEPLSVEGISQKLKIPMNEVLEDVVALNRRGSVLLDRVEDNIPLYAGVKK